MKLKDYIEKRASITAEELFKVPTRRKGVFSRAQRLTELMGHMALSTTIRPIETFKGLRDLPELLKGRNLTPSQKARLLAMTVPSISLGYAPYAYGAYKGSKKVKDYLNNKKR